MVMPHTKKGFLKVSKKNVRIETNGEPTGWMVCVTIWRWRMRIIGKNWRWIRRFLMAWFRQLKPTKGL